jgi:hypothetical protein
LKDGIWEVTNNGLAASRVDLHGKPVLAMAGSGQELYLASPDGVFHNGNMGVASPIFNGPTSLPRDGAKMLSLFVTGGNSLLAGTLAHGIASNGAGAWSTVWEPVATPLLTLQSGEQGLLVVQVDPAMPAATVQAPQGVTLVRVALVGFPLTEIGPQRGRYNLPVGTVVLLLKNDSGNAITLSSNNIQIS